MNESIGKIKQSIQSGQTLIKIISYEEKRVEKYLALLNKQSFNSLINFTWDINNG